jgi:predicted aminopeptidase
MSMAGIVAEALAGRARHALARLLAVLVAASALPGCYVLQAAAGQSDVLGRSEPIEKLLADPTTPAPLLERLDLVVESRRFAIEELGLPDGRSFRKYADLGRPYAVWNVVAAPEFSVTPRRWCYPVAGCVAYRGYFDEARAVATARRLDARGDDVTVGGVATYSTLGYLPDPVFNTMLGWRETRLVGTVFHELAHEHLYVPGDSEFNEAFASVVEQEGVRRWLAARGREGEFEAYRTSLVREAEFAGLLREARERLRRLYASGAPSAQLWADKQGEFGRLKFEYSLLRARWGGYAGYDAWFARPLNNAHLAAVATYHDCVPGLQRELEAAGSLEAFYVRVEELAALARAERHAEVCRDAPGTVGDLGSGPVSSRST